MDVSFIAHSSTDKIFFEDYFLVEAARGVNDWVECMRQWHPVNMAVTSEPRDLTSEEVSLLEDLSSYYQISGSFPLHHLTEDPSALAACGFFSSPTYK